MDHTCDLCRRRFPTPGLLREHLARRVSCTRRPTCAAERARARRCHFCHAVFATSSNKHRHVDNSCRVAAQLRALIALLEEAADPAWLAQAGPTELAFFQPLQFVPYTPEA